MLFEVCEAVCMTPDAGIIMYSKPMNE